MPDTAIPLFKKRGGAKANLRKRPATPPPETNDSSSEYSSDDDTGQRVKRRRKGGVVTTATTAAKADPSSLKADTVTANTTASIAAYNDATKQTDYYEEKMDAKSLLGSTRARPSAQALAAPAAADGSYQGNSGYSNFIQKHPDHAERKVGPQKASTNVRMVTMIDFAPDVCKDYKQTGFCGFGDSCKFLHAREDYKQGWALDRDWEINTKGKKVEGKVVASANRDGGSADDEDAAEAALLEKIPFACVICKKPYTNPIVTKCEHYFCEKCALQRYRKNPNCAACGSGTNGVFNTAKTLGKLLDRKRTREEKIQVEKDAEEEGKET